MDRLAGKVAVVIGAGQSPGESIGNGRATTIRFLEEGASVLAVDRDLDSARETVEMAGAGVGEAFQADVRQSDSLQAAVRSAMDRWGRIDILHYNVGVSLAGGDQPLEEITDEAFDRVMSINLRGAVMVAKYVEPIMRAQRSGVILNVASMSAIETSTSLVTYRASKAGMIAFTQQLAIRNAEYGVRANVILPGRMETAMAVDTRARLTGRPREELMAERRGQVPLQGRAGTGWDIGNAAVFLASDEAGYITGVSLPVDGGTLVKIGW
ncbi:SDR family oxidoreductase [Amycolatopsis rubida]|uniref:SDR family oxidoreductase n=1 Tax=Amycolatopsis rubida TaxID=112413 RepID=A0ABX0C6Q3_9PSEU|nr:MULTISPECIES: SDR family oxidoreductase [Amycolatopsis]MYW96121.1 SDR family oxidoreductase [Amycolatopsis rubida]NEC61112.1 SDR family oxidoreductase [Amycolatopsis rubida]OAP23365.1 Levodione reductase [Amycolatopsis sp. M39]